MREDMFKVIVERPRRGSGWARRGRAPAELDSLPKFLGLKRQVKERGNFKELNENLAPLRRYLEAQVNRPWNKAYSEIRAHIKPGNTVQEHVLTHLYQFLKVDISKGPASPSNPCGLLERREFSWPRGGSPLREGDLYVDPDDGIIKHARRKLRGPRAAKPKRLNRHVAPSSPTPGKLLNKGQYAAPLEGVWYSMLLHPYEVVRTVSADAPPDEHGPQLAFVVHGHTYGEWSDPLHGSVKPSDIDKLRAIAADYGSGLLAGPRRQLAGRELKLHGLENTPQDG